MGSTEPLGRADGDAAAAPSEALTDTDGRRDALTDRDVDRVRDGVTSVHCA